jgi:hypothetical protein
MRSKQREPTSTPRHLDRSGAAAQWRDLLFARVPTTANVSDTGANPANRAAGAFA